MKTYVNFSLVLLLLFLAIFMFSCSEDIPTKSEEEQVEFSSYQISGCNQLALAKVAYDDSCFAYSFTDTLKIDFCVFGNCCPDHQRFDSNYEIKSDTIFVSVVDTAKNLCDCICNYTVHLELSDLSKNQYLFYCNYQNRIEYKEYVNK